VLELEKKVEERCKKVKQMSVPEELNVSLICGNQGVLGVLLRKIRRGTLNKLKKRKGTPFPSVSPQFKHYVLCILKNNIQNFYIN